MDYRKKLLSLILSLNILTLSSCAKNVDCNIEEKHVHEYSTEDGITRIIDSEKEYIKGDLIYYRTDNYIELDKDNSKLYKFISKHGLVNINDNLDSIRKLNQELTDYMFYRYKYTQIVSYTTSDGKGHTTIHSRPETRYSWTTNPNHSGLTGEVDIVTHVFYGFNIVVTDSNKLKLQKSGPVQDLDTLIKMGYKYISSDICEEIKLSEYYRRLGIDFNEVFDESDYEKTYGEDKVYVKSLK